MRNEFSKRTEARRCFLFKPDGIGDFFLASGVIRFLSREFGEQNLIIAVLPIMEAVVKGQFPAARVILLPLRTRRVILNKFVANCLRCFAPWLGMLRLRVDLSISLRNMRDYLQTVLFFSVPAKNRVLCVNPLLESNRPVRRWTEKAFQWLFRSQFVNYPKNSLPGVPSEVEAHRLLLCEAMGREVSIEEIWPKLKAVCAPPVEGEYWVCAPFSSGLEKDFPLERWVELFGELHNREMLSKLLLTGSADQKGRLEQFQSLLSERDAGLAQKIALLLPPDLQDFIDLLAGAHCVTTVDTAAAHAATALDCRTLVLFSGKHQGMFAPWIRSKRQCWLLPKEDDSESKPWHESRSTDEILASLDGVLKA